MLNYYPAITPYQTLRLPVQLPHELYIETCGNSKGIPIVFVHGGPGAGCTEDNRCYFDPSIYHIILFDQRGCGRSTPHASLQDNNTQALIEDMEAIRQHLGIAQWILFGGSWGSTLSLAYAEAHPDKVLGLILRGIFLNRDHDVQWLFGGKGANYVFPDCWQGFIQPIPSDQHQNLLKSYYQLLTGDDEVSRMGAAKAWATWESRCATLSPNKRFEAFLQNPRTALSLACLECHYFINQCFLQPDQLINNINKINHLPAVLVHGRYDMVCALDNAWTLHQAWPNSELDIVRNAGHAGSEPGIIDALVKATRSMPNKI